MIELFKLNRGYNELAERLDITRVNNIEYLPCEIGSTANDDKVGDIDYLPYEITDVVDEYNDITYLMVTKNTDGDRTKNTNVDGLYELIMGSNLGNYSCDIGDESIVKSYYINVMSINKDDKCYVKVRLIYDDGGYTTVNEHLNILIYGNDSANLYLSLIHI